MNARREVGTRVGIAIATKKDSTAHGYDARKASPRYLRRVGFGYNIDQFLEQADEVQYRENYFSIR